VRGGGGSQVTLRTGQDITGRVSRGSIYIDQTSFVEPVDFSAFLAPAPREKKTGSKEVKKTAPAPIE